MGNVASGGQITSTGGSSSPLVRTWGWGRLTHSSTATPSSGGGGHPSHRGYKTGRRLNQNYTTATTLNNNSTGPVCLSLGSTNTSGQAHGYGITKSTSSNHLTTTSTSIRSDSGPGSLRVTRSCAGKTGPHSDDLLVKGPLSLCAWPEVSELEMSSGAE